MDQEAPPGAEHPAAAPAMPARRLWFWLALVGFILVVAVLGGLFAVAARDRPSPDGYIAYVAPPPSTPLTIIADPAAPGEYQPTTVARVRESAASASVSLPGQLAGVHLFSFVEAAGLDILTTEVVRTVTTSSLPDGSPSSLTTVSLLLDDGYADLLVVASNGGALMYDPAVLTFPAVDTPGHTWTVEGMTNALAPFSISGEALGGVQISDPPGPLDTLEGCRDVRVLFDQEFPGSEGYSAENISTLCPGWGSVAATNAVTGVFTRVASPQEAAWPEVTLPEPASRPPGTRLAAPTPVTSITRAPVPTRTGMVYANDTNGDLLSITVAPPAGDAPDTSATALWIQHPGGQVLGLSQSGDRTYVTSSLRALLAFDDAGRMRWDARLPDAAVGAPAVVGDVVAAALVDGTLRGFDSVSGAPRWVVPLSDVVLEPPAAADGFFLAADSAGCVVAVGPDGDVRWAGSLDRVDQPITVLGDGSALFAQATGFLTRLDSAGGEMWTVPLLEGSVLTGGVLRDGVIVLPTDGGLLGVDADTGEVMWSQDGLTSGTLSTDGTLVADRDRVLSVAIDGSTELVADVSETSGNAPAKLFLVPFGGEWIAVSQEGAVTFLGVPREQ